MPATASVNLLVFEALNWMTSPEWRFSAGLTAAAGKRMTDSLVLVLLGRVPLTGDPTVGVLRQVLARPK